MAATSSSSENPSGRDEDVAPPADTTSPSSHGAPAPWPLAVISTAVSGALVGALVAFVWGCLALTAYTLNLSRAGFFKNWLIVAAYTGRSFSALTILVLATAALGALAFPAAVRLRDDLAAPTSRLRRVLDRAWNHLRHFFR